MTCPHCGSTYWYELVDGRSRCSVCFATYETPKREKPKEHAEGNGEDDE